MEKSENSAVFITGGASGIGWATALKFADSGWNVEICDADAQRVEEVTSAHERIKAFCVDVRNSSELEKIIKLGVKRYGGYSVLINNAGIAGPTLPIEEVSIEQWKNTIDINLTAAFVACKAVIPEMKRRQAGIILNIATASVRIGLPNRAPYIASKDGLIGLTKTLSRELGPYNIRCNAILPGAVTGARSERVLLEAARIRGVSFEEIERSTLDYISMRTWVTPEEIAATSFFLASNEAAHITGQFLGVCGNLEWE